jgi:hypothetical protein
MAEESTMVMPADKLQILMSSIGWPNGALPNVRAAQPR